MCFVKDTLPSILSSVTVVECLNEINESNIVIEIVQFLQSLYVTLVNYLGFINGTPIIQKPSTMYFLS